jgi:hypothetical protein
VFTFSELNGVRDREQYQVEISNRIVTLENLDDVDINRAWETIKLYKFQPKGV